MAVAPIKLTQEINDIELAAHFNNARLSERLMLLERLESKLVNLNSPNVSRVEVFKELSRWISEVKSVANSSTENKEVK